MPERSWDQVVKSTEEKKMKELFGNVPDYIRDSPIFTVWEKKYTPQQIFKLLELHDVSWEKEREAIALVDPMNREKQ